MSEIHSVRSGGARSTGSLTVPAAVEDLPALLARAVAGSREFRIDRTRPGSVELYRRTNWFTWGETLVAEFSAVDAAHTTITVRSRPTFPLQVQDWGQSRKDVAALLGAVSAVAHGSASPLSGDAPETGRRNGLSRQLPIVICVVAAAGSVLLGTLLLAQH